MTQEDKVALKEFLSGAAVAIGITVVFVVIIFASGIVSVGNTCIQQVDRSAIVLYHILCKCQPLWWTVIQLMDFV